MFKKILVSDFLTSILSQALSIYIYWYAYSNSLDQGVIAIIGASQLCGIFLSTLGGGIADKFNKLNFIKLLMSARILLIVGMILLLNKFEFTIAISMFMFLSTIIGSLHAPTLESIIPSLSKTDEELYKNNSIATTFSQISSIVAIFISVVYITVLDFKQTLFASLFISILAWIVIVNLKMDVVTNTGTNSVLQNIKEGVSYIFKTNYIRSIVPIALVTNFCFWSIFLLLPKISVDSFSFFKGSYSFLELAFSVGGIIGGIIFSKYLVDVTDKFKIFKTTLILQSTILLIIGLMLLLENVYVSYLIIVVLWAVYASVNTLVSISYFSTVQKNTPEKIMGSVIGAILSIFSLVNPIAAVLTGYIVNYSSISTIVIVFALIMLITAIITFNVKGLKEKF